MQSIFDAMINITSTSSTVTVVHKKGTNHAGIIIESMRLDNFEREIRYAHFLPQEVKNSTSDLQAVIHTLNDFIAEPREGKVDQRVIYGIQSSADLIVALGLKDCEMTPYEKARNIIDPFTQVIRQEAQKLVPVPQFHIRGLAYSSDVLNCRSWVRQKMSTIGVDYPLSWIDHNSSDTLNSDNYSTCTLV